MKNTCIPSAICEKVIMAGNYYRHNHPGGISSVIQYWSEYFERLQYYPTYKLSNIGVRAFWFATSYLRMIVKMCVDPKVRIVHLHSAADGSFWRKAQLIKLSKLFNKKTILHIHASRFKDFYNESIANKKRWIESVLHKTDILVVLSESWKEWFVGIGIQEEKIVVLHNITSYPTIIQENQSKDNKIHFLFMGEIGQRKGVFDILRGLVKYRNELKDKLELRIGGNRNEEQLIQFIKDNNLGDLVKFEGWVSGEKKIRLLNWADVYILPSFNEGLPISILEAMSYGCPIISTPVGGIPEVVSSNGILVTPGNEEEIYAAMKRYVNNPELIQIEGKESFKKVESYLPDRVMEDLKNIYERL